MGMFTGSQQRSPRIDYMYRRVTGRKYKITRREREDHEGIGVCGLLGTSHDEV